MFYFPFFFFARVSSHRFGKIEKIVLLGGGGDAIALAGAVTTLIVRTRYLADCTLCNDGVSTRALIGQLVSVVWWLVDERFCLSSGEEKSSVTKVQ